MPTVVAKTLNQTEINKSFTNANSLAQTNGFKATSSTFVWIGAFDGTNNDRTNVPLSGNPLSTNVGQMATQLEAANANNANVKMGYFEGPGATNPVHQVLHDGQITTAAQRAYTQFNTQARDWLADNPGGDVTIMATSFSRGGVTVAEFSQLVYERGVTAADGTVLIAPGTSMIAGGVFLDTVDTGSYKNSAIVGVRSDADLKFTQSEHEFRDQFKATNNSTQNGTTLYVDGNHCDNGGGSDRGLGAIVLGGQDGSSGMMGYFKNKGVETGTLDSSRTYNANAPTVIHKEVGTGPQYSYYGSVEEGSVRQTQPGVFAPTTTTRANGDVSTSYSRLDAITNQTITVFNTVSQPDANDNTTRTFHTEIPNGTGGWSYGTFARVETSADKLTVSTTSLNVTTGQYTTRTTVKSNIQDDGSHTLTTTLQSGTKIAETVDSGGKLFQTATTTGNEVSNTTVYRTATGVLKHTTITTHDDDGNTLEVTTYPSGRIETKLTSADGVSTLTKIDTNGDRTTDQIVATVDKNGNHKTDPGESVTTNPNASQATKDEAWLKEQLDAKRITQAEYNDFVGFNSANMVSPGASGLVAIINGGINFPIGAYYESTTSTTADTTPSIAQRTAKILSSTGVALTAAQLTALDANLDGKLSGAELAGLQAYRDLNESGLIDSVGSAATDEVMSLAAYLATQNQTTLKSSDYAFYTQGALAPYAAPGVPLTGIAAAVQALLAPPAEVASNYQSLRDTGNFRHISGSPLYYWVYKEWNASEVKQTGDDTTLLGTAGNDNFDYRYYSSTYWLPNGALTKFMAGAGDDLMGGSVRSDQLWGGTGVDVLLGESDSDTYYVDQAGDVAAYSPEAAQPLFGVGCRERSAAQRNVESRHLTPNNDLRQFAHSFRLPASSPHGTWLAGHKALQAANDGGWRVAA